MGHGTFSQPQKPEQDEETLATTLAKTKILNQIDFFSAAETFINSSKLTHKKPPGTPGGLSG